MSEKVLGFYEKDALKDNVNVLFANPFCLWHIEPKKLVPVNLKSESVTLEWLEKERDKIREYNSNQTEESDFMRGWLKGSSDGAEALFEAAKKQAGEKEMSAITKFGDEWDYFCSRINFGKSPFDARAICFMNEIGNYLKAIAEESAKIRVGEK